uniref:PX domain-containing protein n=1 Tax=Sus scrofa TaxID=9823 RepID=A0A8D0XX33_PIG
MAETVADTRRLITKPQNLNDAYGPPSNFLEIDVSNPQTVGVGRGRFTTYEIRVKTNLPIFKLKESTVRRRYSDFEWLRSELERESKFPHSLGKHFCVNFLLEEMMEYLMTILLKKGSKGWSSL